ncbi:GNAT family N-acetyltransferase [Jidongwangia harbinensis]|uniref:GNAT family N-acetyltransferase n=1 Tax=Jidongwangia harbinensis TaxID=2878561 RepID=UPI001CD999CC|nr:GNAT family N-acetyltransferase [Jidongwangia harbinensis]MCA2212307.1 GNAT family N-acetyltransferase [Jidongwangia harbinensis]
MPESDEVNWAPLDGAADDLVALAMAGHARDGGLSAATDPGFLRGRWSAEGVVTLGGWVGGRLVAAGAVRPYPADGGALFTGLVHPDWRGRGLGSRLLDWGLAEGSRLDQAEDSRLDQAEGSHPDPVEGGRPDQVGEGVVAAVEDGPLAPALERPAGNGPVGAEEDGSISPEGGGRVTVETESLVPAAEALFRSRGLRQVFAEDVLRIDLTEAVPEPVWPPGTVLRDWSGDTAPRFFAVYQAAFRERPGFPGWSAEEWIGDADEDADFRPRLSVLATVPGVGDAGFLLAESDRIAQVGVVPAARGAGVGAALVREALRRMRAGGAVRASLEVNVNNPAGRLYRRLGFIPAGRRARYAT